MTKPSTTTGQPASIHEAAQRARTWLEPYGLSLEILLDDTGKDRLGYYERGSVFTDTITIGINPEAIKESCTSLPFPEDINEQIRITIYHEIGHAILERIIDWDEYYEDMKPAIKEQETKYPDIFDDSVDEETLVEDFAWAFENGHENQLKNCWEALAIAE